LFRDSIESPRVHLGAPLLYLGMEQRALVTEQGCDRLFDREQGMAAMDSEA